MFRITIFDVIKIEEMMKKIKNNKQNWFNK